jgi:hypothetical protein
MYGFVPTSQPWLHSELLWNRWSTPDGDWRYRGPVQFPWENALIAQGYGATPAPSTTDPTTYFQQAGAAAGAFASAQDLRKQIAKLQAQITNYQDMARRVPFAAFYYNNQITVKQAEIDALNQNLALQVQGEQATTDYRSLAQTGGAVAIVGGVIAVVILGLVAVKAAKVVL